jgi:hypothetical protein
MTPITPRSMSLLCVLMICLPLSAPAKAQSPQPKANDDPFVADYYYKAKWGYADEFIRLFKKNHFPILKKQIETGRILSVTAARPRYHATEEGRWDYLSSSRTWQRPQTRQAKNPSSNNFTRIRKRSGAKSNDGSRF